MVSINNTMNKLVENTVNLTPADKHFRHINIGPSFGILPAKSGKPIPTADTTKIRKIAPIRSERL